ncbi:argininosuccinate synthase (plasmid) [Agrobacterium vitis]|uniref:argininosuccinate synthase-related protein n=1 Tax=Agrobacterium vitis TaxID=373 RepID=UPI0015DCD5B0|nr:argininosuccinate synthase-related protein [Agrobacterium vitis]BCH62528.1 argininosuccinate synthase [Agrobacterium vitis]
MNFVPQSIKISANRVSNFEDLIALPDRSAPVVTMFSGGLDSTYLLYKLQSLGFKNVQAVAVNVGETIDGRLLEQVAMQLGARFVYLDGREAFVEGGVKPAIRAHAKYLGNYPLSSSLSRPVIASLVVDYATSIGARVLLHTANLSQNSLPRLNNSIKRCGFEGYFGSPYQGSVLLREQKAAALAQVGLTFMTDRHLSGDENLWCREFESGPLDDPESFSIPEDAFSWTREAADRQTEDLNLGFLDGNLVSIDNEDIALIDAISILNQKIGKFGHGRFVGLEHISSGEKVLEVREAPAAAIIMDALRHLETASLSTGSIILKQGLEQAWAQEAVSGNWGSTIHKMCDQAIITALQGVSGYVRYSIDSTRFLPKSIVAHNPKYIRDRELWEYQAAGATAPVRDFDFA